MDVPKSAWLIPFIRPLRPIFAEVLAMSFFVNAIALAVPVFSLQVYDRVIGNQGYSTLQGLVIGMLVVLAFDFVLRQARSRILQTVALRIDVLVGREVFRKF
ncbi:MAG: peptidase domain-containing ABC transporter, partial [Pseudomonadota bacterium]